MLHHSTTPSLPAFLAQAPKTAHVVILHDWDADGIAAGVVLQRALERMGWTDVRRVMPDRDRNAWTPANRARVAEARPDLLFVLDLGSQSRPVVEGVPTCFIDHHRPEGVPPGDTLISGYERDPIPNTSLMVWELVSGLVDVSDLDWVAAIGTFSDLGEHAPFPLVEATRAKYKAKYLKEATTLVNAARRASAPDPEAAARALLENSSPRELVESDSPDVRWMRAAREEVKAALAEAKKAAPKFAGPVALVRVHSRCQVHPLIAQIWRTRLPKYVVIVANDGYQPGRVNFSARAASGTNVLEFLRGFTTEADDEEPNFGHGHDQASGGSVPVARWQALLRQLEFASEEGN